MNRLFMAALVAAAAVSACSAPSPTAVVPTVAPKAPSAAAAAPAAAATTAPVATSTPAAATARPTQAAPTPAATSAPAATAAPAPVAAQGSKVNLNTASDQQLLNVPNSGQRMLREFREYRPYTSILQFRKEIGKYVNAQQVADYEKYLFVPIDPNKADAATLQQLPGVTTEVANKLIAARPYANKGAFVKQLGDLAGQDNAGTGAYMIEAQ